MGTAPNRAAVRRRALRPMLLATALVVGATSCIAPLPSEPSDPSPSAGTYAPPASIDATGTHDVTAQLQQFLTTIPHGATVNFPAGAKYRIEGELTFRRRNDVVLNGNGALFFATTRGDRSRGQWKLEDLSRVTFQGFVIRGAHPNGGMAEDAYVADLEAQHGIEIAGGSDIVVRKNRITDVYGDFVYVSRSPSPIFGTPYNVTIAANVMRRNGRQGVALGDGYNIRVENNDMAEMRRASFDLEPYAEGGELRNVFIRNNKVGPGRLMFVAAHGRGIVSDLYVQDNTVTGMPLGIDLASSDTTGRRSNVVVSGNRSDTADGNDRLAFMRFVRYDHVQVLNNVQPSQAGRPMQMAGSYDSCDVVARGNDTGDGRGDTVVVLSSAYDCSQMPALAPFVAPSKFEGEKLTIDVGGAGYAPLGIEPCLDVERCDGSLEAPAAVVVAGPIRNLDTAAIMYRTMLVGDLRFEIPIASGVYDVTLTFVEPTAQKTRVRRFHVDAERERRINSLDVFEKAGGANILLRRTFTVTVGDGSLSLRLFGDPAAILSMATISRA